MKDKTMRFFVHLFIVYLFIIHPLSGCGFQPVHQKKPAGPLYQYVDVPLLTTNHTEQLFSNALADLLDPENDKTARRYNLQLRLTRDEIPIITRQDRAITRYRITLTAFYTLNEGDKKITDGNAKIRVSYDGLANDFANYSAQVDSEERAAKELAQLVYQRLQGFLIRQQ